MRALMWFRSDLRIDDNPALHEAAESADRGVLAVYIITPKQWGTHDLAPARADFILRNLAELSSSLREKQIALRVLRCDDFSGIPKLLTACCTQNECDALYFNQEHEFNEAQRDACVEDAMTKAGVRVRSFTDQCIFEPGSLRTGEGRYYRVFTPFRRSWSTAIEADPERISPLPPPKRQAAMIGHPDTPPRAVSGFEHTHADSDLWPAGEPAAHARLTEFANNKIEDYKLLRDTPSVDATSTLSPYLASGVISLRRCLAAARQTTNSTNDGVRPGANQWISELAWREFYKHIMVGFPRVCMHRPFQLDTEEIQWNNNTDHFEAWCNAQTGYPIVDAAMRQLLTTGWMHNRLRMIVAMFFTKNLFLDWRRGEQFFMRHLIDGDLAANNGGWQWSASTGTDAAPYFRVFNPISQSAKCDPDGVFIRRYLPELASIEGKAIHAPSTLPPLARAAINYPQPIVDHASTRKHAIEAFKRRSR